MVILAGREKQKILNWLEACTVAPQLEVMMPAIKEGQRPTLQLNSKIYTCSAHDMCVRALISLASRAKQCFAQ